MDVTIKVLNPFNMEIRDITMLGVTTVGYAARRCAREFNLEDEIEWTLTDDSNGRALPQEDIIKDHQSKRLILTLPGM